MIKSKKIFLPKISDARGNLSFLESNNHIPFDIARTYWIYDVPEGAIRGEYAFKCQHEFIIAMSGSFDIILNDGENEYRYHLNRSSYGLYIPPRLWVKMENFSSNSFALVVASSKCNERDYLKSFEQFKFFINEK